MPSQNSCYTPGAARGSLARVEGPSGRRAFTIDMHCHVHVPALEAMVSGRPEKQAELANRARMQGEASVAFNTQVTFPAALPSLTDPDRRLDEMEAMGVDVQVVSPSPGQYYYWADPDLARDLVRAQNEQIAALCARQPHRFLGLGNLSLQHPDLALQQLDYAVGSLGLKGVEISTAVGGRELSDKAFEKVWARLDELGCVVFIHPLGTSLGERVNRHYLQNIIGQPLETTLALSYLIFDGVLDRFPRVKICAAHGGGYLPAYTGRADHAWAHRPDCQHMAQPLSAYLQRIWFDSLVYTPEALSQLVAQVGVANVVVGTDYPFDMGHYDVHGLVAGVQGLSGADREAILGLNAARLLGINIEDLRRGMEAAARRPLTRPS